MPYQKDGKRDYKAQWAWQKENKDGQAAQLERQRARRALDKKSVDRKGKDVAHVKALSKGGSNAQGVRLESPHKNRSFARTAKGKMK